LTGEGRRNVVWETNKKEQRKIRRGKRTENKKI